MGQESFRQIQRLRAARASTSLSVIVMIGCASMVALFGSQAVPNAEPEGRTSAYGHTRVQPIDITKGNPSPLLKRQLVGTAEVAGNDVQAVDHAKQIDLTKQSVTPPVTTLMKPSQRPAPSLTVFDTWSQSEVESGSDYCKTQLAGLISDSATLAPMKSGQCGTPVPILLRSLGTRNIELRPAAVTTCGMAKALDLWLATKVQPIARELFGSYVKHLAVASSYSCRNRNNALTGPISEHAFANAIDITEFILEDGRKVSVLADWGATKRDKSVASENRSARPNAPVASVSKLAVPAASPHQPDAPAAAIIAAAAEPIIESKGALFLHRIHNEACGIFSTALGPEANDFHRDHFHFDLKQRRQNAFCE